MLSLVEIMAWHQVGDNWQTTIWTNDDLVHWSIYTQPQLPILGSLHTPCSPVPGSLHSVQSVHNSTLLLIGSLVWRWLALFVKVLRYLWASAAHVLKCSSCIMCMGHDTTTNSWPYYCQYQQYGIKKSCLQVQLGRGNSCKHNWYNLLWNEFSFRNTPPQFNNISMKSNQNQAAFQQFSYQVRINGKTVVAPLHNSCAKQSIYMNVCACMREIKK